MLLDNSSRLSWVIRHWANVNGWVHVGCAGVEPGGVAAGVQQQAVG
jgi:hypothetical protein